MSYQALSYINKVRKELCSNINKLQQNIPGQSLDIDSLTDAEKTAELSFLTSDGLAQLLGQSADKHPVAMIDAIRHVEEATRIYRDLKILKQDRTQRILNGISGLNAQRNMMRYFIKNTDDTGSSDNTEQ